MTQGTGVASNPPVSSFVGRHRSVAILIALALLAVAMVVAHLTPFGRAVYAVGGNEQSAQMMGLPVGATKVAVYAISGGCAALAG